MHLKLVIDAFEKKHGNNVFLVFRSIHIAPKAFAGFFEKGFEP
jgi:hypothetical protein